MPEVTQVGTGKKVLVVDDHETTRQTIARMLEAGGFSVVQASSAAEALERLARESEEIDMVLSDVTMPGMSGIDLSYQIRELYPSMPVAIVSGDVSELERSIIYNDYGRTDTFNWDIDNGHYAVTVSIGFADKTYSKQRVVVEGQVLFDDVETNPGEPYKSATVEVDIADGNVTIETGQTDEYTMLAWMSIEPVR